jgi:general stress protein 26
MITVLPLSFIQHKIEELRNALFFSASESLLKIPTHIVNVLKVDELGQIWFAIPKPAQHIHEFDNSFAAKLDFFKKGKDFYLKILGKAFIVNDPEEINTIIYINDEIKDQARKNEIVLMKVKITHADYAEKKPAQAPANSILTNARLLLYKWFAHSQKNEHSLSVFKKVPVRGIMSDYNVFTN